MMQFSDVNGSVLGLVLLALFIACTGYAWVVREMDKRGMKDLMVWQVIFGTLIVLTGYYFVFGIVPTIGALLCFSAAGIPMVIEYVTRIENARRADERAAKKAQRDLLK
jgi:predicted Kef-type K+ transport protein